MTDLSEFRDHELWYKGSVAEAIAKAKAENRMLMVFVRSPLSSTESDSMERMLLSEDVAEYVQGEGVVALRLTVGSEPAKQFAQVYTFVVVPSTFLIGRNGAPLEIIAGTKNNGVEFTVAHVKTKIQKAVKQFRDSVGSSPLPSSASGPSGSGSSSQEPVTDRVQYAQQLLNKKKAEQAQLEIEEEKKREKERRELGKNMLDQQQKVKDRELQDIAEERRRQRAADKEALNKIRQQIAADRAEKRIQYDQKQNDEDEQLKERLVKQKERKDKDAAEVAREQAERNKIARLQFKFPDGSTTSNNFESNLVLTDVIEWIDQKRPNVGNFSLIHMYPRREFSPAELGKSLLELSLAPSATLVVMPVGGRLTSSPNTGSLTDKITLLVQWPFQLLYAAYCWMYDYATRPKPIANTDTNMNPQVTEATKLQRQAERDQRVRRLVRDPDADDDNATWNGNSTQQL